MYKIKANNLIKDLLSILGFLEYSVGEVILFKKEPSHETISDMKNLNGNSKDSQKSLF